jgi:hypothetical protein
MVNHSLPGYTFESSIMQKVNNNFQSLRVPFIAFLIVISIISSTVHSQEQTDDWALFLGGSIGYAPQLTLGDNEYEGLLYGAFLDIQRKNIMGRLKLSIVSPGSIDNSNFEGAFGFHGSVGYSLPVTGQFRVPVMVIAGLGVVKFNNSADGTGGSSFTDANPQLGFTVAPYFQLTRVLSLQASFRYLRGFTVDSRSKTIHAMDYSAGVRITL